MDVWGYFRTTKTWVVLVRMALDMSWDRRCPSGRQQIPSGAKVEDFMLLLGRLLPFRYDSCKHDRSGAFGVLSLGTLCVAFVGPWLGLQGLIGIV